MHNISHLILTKSLDGGESKSEQIEGFEILSMEATTQQGSTEETEEDDLETSTAKFKADYVANADYIANGATSNNKQLNNSEVQAQEVSVRFVVKGLMKNKLLSKVSCSEGLLCSKTLLVCGSGGVPKAKCSVSEKCHDKSCECNVKTICPHQEENKSVPKANSMMQSIVTNTTRYVPAKKPIGKGNSKLEEFRYRRFVSRKDLSAHGIDKCLTGCFSFQGLCTSSRACDLVVQCFNDYCVCDMSLLCVVKKTVSE